MSLLSSLFSAAKRNKEQDKETPEVMQELTPGMLLKVYIRGMPPIIGALSSSVSGNLQVARQAGQPALEVCRKGDSAFVMPLDGTESEMFMMRGTVLISTPEVLRLENTEFSVYQNRRAADRVQAGASILLYDEHDTALASIKDAGSLLDISTGGVRVRSRSLHPKGTRVQGRVRFVGRDPILLRGTIVHSDGYGSSAYHCGIQFDTISGENLEVVEKVVKVNQKGGNTDSRSAGRKKGQAFLRADGVLSDLRENMKQDLERYPDAGKDFENFFGQLEQTIQTRYPKTRVWENQATDTQSMVCLYISGDRMSAYICVLPPVSGDKEIDPEYIMTELRERGTLGNVSPDAIEGIKHLHIVLLAQGIPAIDGVDGVVKELYPRRRRFTMLPHRRREPNFVAGILPPAVPKGGVICQIQRPMEGKNGLDVTGRPVVCRRAACPPIPMGENTQLSPNKDALVASVDGVLYVENGNFCIQPQSVAEHGLNGGGKMLRYSGNLFIDGDVSGGVRVEAEGDIIVAGEIRDARVTSKGGSIRVQAGICGMEGQTFVDAAGELQAKEIRNAEVHVGGDVVTNVIENSTLTCGDLVVVLDGEGAIYGSVIEAREQILCRRIDGSARKCKFTLGCDPNVLTELTRIQRELAQAQKTQEVLWKNTGQMRMSISRLSDAQKEVLKQLLEQRDLYEQKIKDLKQARKELSDKTRIDYKVHVRCDELEPVLEIRIGDQTDRFTQRERKCDIHLENGWISAKK